MNGATIESVLRGWQGALAQTEHSFSTQTKQISSVDASLSQQRTSMRRVQTDLCSLSAAQHRLRSQLEMLEKHQSEIEASLLSLEGDVSKLGSDGPTSPHLDRNDAVFHFAEGLSVQLKQVCEKVHAIQDTVEDEESEYSGMSTVSRCVRVLHRQLKTLKLLEGKISQVTSAAESMDGFLR